MADATAVIRLLGEQLAQAIVDKTIAQVEISELKLQLETLEPSPDAETTESVDAKHRED